jgi:hypothetical protein
MFQPSLIACFAQPGIDLFVLWAFRIVNFKGRLPKLPQSVEPGWLETLEEDA